MERETSSLLIKANRVLGMRLVEAGLTTGEDMEEANALFIERARAKDLTRASLLRILLFEKAVLKESALIDYQLENFAVGAVRPDNFRVDPSLMKQTPLELLRASWSFPLDLCEGQWFMAGAYYLSDVVRTFWVERLGAKINWYVSPMVALEAAFSMV